MNDRIRKRLDEQRRQQPGTMGSSDSEDEYTPGKGRLSRRRRRLANPESAKNGRGKKDQTSSEKGGIGSLIRKYSSFGNMRPISGENKTKDFTDEEVDALRTSLERFINTESRTFSKLVHAEGAVSVQVSERTDACIRFTVTPFYNRIDVPLASQISTELRQKLPGFSFVPARQESQKRRMHLVPSGGTTPFAVSTHVESMSPVIEFRRTDLDDRMALVATIAVLGFFALLFLYNIISIYTGQGYSLRVACKEMVDSFLFLLYEPFRGTL